MDIEDKETSIEQARKKYQMEFSTIHSDLEIERENVIHARSENTRLRDELEELRSKWDDEVLNSSTWAKEKSRLEMTLQDLSSSRDEAVDAHNEAQSKIVSLLAQVRNLRTSMDDATSERDLLQKDKRSLEGRLKEAGERLDSLERSESPSMRNAAGMDRTLLDLKSKLAQQEDVAAAAVGKMRRAEALTTEMQKDVIAERDNNVALHREKAVLEKSLKDLQGRVVDLETKGYTSASQDVRFLNGRVQEVRNFHYMSIPPLPNHMLTVDPTYSLNTSSKLSSKSTPHLYDPLVTSTVQSKIYKLSSPVERKTHSSWLTTSPKDVTRSNVCYNRSTNYKLRTPKHNCKLGERSVISAKREKKLCG